MDTPLSSLPSSWPSSTRQLNIVNNMETNDLCDESSNSEATMLSPNSIDASNESHLLTEVSNNTASEDCVSLEGRRIVDVQHLTSQINMFPHHGLFSCKGNTVTIIREKRRGFFSEFQLKCKMCHVSHVVTSENMESGQMEVNAAAVSAVVSTGGGYSTVL